MNQSDLLLKKADEFDRSGQTLHAVQIYQRVLDEFNEPKSLIRLLNAYKKLKNPGAGVKKIINYFNTGFHDPDLILYAAHYLINSEMFDEAIEILSNVDKEKYPDACFLMGKSYMKLGEYKIAKSNFINYLERGNSLEAVPITFLFLSEVEIKLNNLDAALEYASQAEKEYHNLDEIDYLYARIYYLKGMYQHGYDRINKIVDIDDISDKYLLAGKICYELSDYDSAFTYLSNYLEENMDCLEALILLGNCSLKLRKYEHAEEYFQSALKINPKDSNALNGLEAIKVG